MNMKTKRLISRILAFIMLVSAIMCNTVFITQGAVATYKYISASSTNTNNYFSVYKTDGSAVQTSTNGGTQSVEGSSLKSGIKMQLATVISFTTTEPANVKLYAVGRNNSDPTDKSIKIDNNVYSIANAPSSVTCITALVGVGEHTITRGDGESYVYYVSVEYNDLAAPEYTMTGTLVNETGVEVTINGEILTPGEFSLGLYAGKYVPAVNSGLVDVKITDSNGIVLSEINLSDNISGLTITVTEKATYKVAGAVTGLEDYNGESDIKVILKSDNYSLGVKAYITKESGFTQFSTDTGVIEDNYSLSASVVGYDLTTTSFAVTDGGSYELAFDKADNTPPVVGSIIYFADMSSDAQWLAGTKTAAGIKLYEAFVTGTENCTIDGKDFTGKITGNTNAVLDEDGVLAFGSGFSTLSPVDGTLSIYTKVNANKTVKIVDSNGTEVGSYAAASNTYTSITVDVTAGETYYVFGLGTKPPFYGIKYTNAKADAYSMTWKASDMVYGEDYSTGAGFNGLMISGVAKENGKDQISGSNGTIKVPMNTIPDGMSAVVTVEYYYKSAFNFEGGATQTTVNSTNTTAKTDKASYIYNANAANEQGYVTINVTGTTYITSISRSAIDNKVVSGNISSVIDLTNAQLKFINNSTGGIYYVDCNGTYSIELPAGYTYTIDLDGITDYTTDTDCSSVTVGTSNVTLNVNIVEAAANEITGEIIDLTSEELSKVNITYIRADETIGTDAVINTVNSTYTVNLKPGTYNVSASRIDGRELSPLSIEPLVVVKNTKGNRNLWFAPIDTVEKVPYVDTVYVGADKEYKTVSAAVKAIGKMDRSNSQRVTIMVDAGTYREQVILNEPNVTLKSSSGKNDVVITWYYGIGYNYYSADRDGFYSEDHAKVKSGKNACTSAVWGTAFFVNSNATDFLAENIIFENSFNFYMTAEEIADGVESQGTMAERTSSTDVRKYKLKERANALAILGDRAEFYQCEIRSVQDTLGYNGGRDIKTYFNECTIAGSTDYICGGGAMIFDNCKLQWVGHSDQKSGGYIVAPKSTAPAGYLFRNCEILNDNTNNYVESGYFGRPWAADAKAIFANTTIESGAIVDKGWTDMSGNSASNAYFYEYNNTRAGSAFKSSVGKHMSDDEYSNVSYKDYLGEWIPVHYAGVIDVEDYSVTWAGAQAKANDDGTYSIRILGTLSTEDIENIEKVGFAVGVTQGVSAADMKELSTTTVFQSVVAEDVTVTAGELNTDGKYIVGYVITNVPNDGVIYVYTMYTKDGSTYYSTDVQTINVADLLA